MSPRWDDPTHAAESLDDDRRHSESTELSGDRDRAEGSPEQGDGRDTDGPGTGPEMLDPAEERAATDEASLRERSRAGAQRAVEVAATYVAAGVVSAASILGWQKTDDRLPDAARAAATAAEAVKGMASDVRNKRNHEGAAEEPDRVIDPQEQPPPDREGERAATSSPTVDRPPAEAPHPEAADDD